MRTLTNPQPSTIPPPSRDPSDLELVSRILAGDQSMLELVMRRYNGLLYRLARAIVADDDEARDVVQAAYIQAYYHLEQFRGPFGIQSWLARIAVNEANARRRRKSPTLVCDDETLQAVAAHESFEPEHIAMSTQTTLLVERAIERLPDDFRAVFVLRGVQQLTVAETSAALGVKPATVKTRFHRARAMLRASLGPLPAEAVQRAFKFDGVRCDEIVAAVLQRLRRHQ